METIAKHLRELSSQMGIKPMGISELQSAYKGIELTDMEAETALYVARMLKNGQIEHEKYIETQRQRAHEIERPWSSEELYQYILRRSISEFGYSRDNGADGKPVFIVDESNCDILTALCHYFTNDPRFEELNSNWSLRKGICLMGSVGRGKTELMRLFASNKRQCFYVVSCRKAGSDYAQGGSDLIGMYSTWQNLALGDPRTFNQRKAGFCFDDLGTEETKSHFGNKVNVMAEIILNRYDNRSVMGWECTHITTNLSADEIEQYYGSRVRSRFREMFNAIELKGFDRRK